MIREEILNPYNTFMENVNHWVVKNNRKPSIAIVSENFWYKLAHELTREGYLLRKHEEPILLFGVDIYPSILVKHKQIILR